MKRLLLLITLINSSAYSMYNYRTAKEKDVPGLLKLMNEQAINDRTKIVILPERFRQAALEKAIEMGRLFVATQPDDTVVGYKKLFLLDDEDEKQGILSDEIRCIGSQAECTYAGYADASGALIPDRSDTTVDPSMYSTCIYNGGDFTAPAHRAQGINSQLTDTALTLIAPYVRAYARKQTSKVISMVFGLTQANAGDQPGQSGDRTPSIARSFARFIGKVDQPTKPISFAHSRYTAFMPTFDSKAEECRPLPDDQSITGYGCVLSYQPRSEDK